MCAFVKKKIREKLFCDFTFMAKTTLIIIYILEANIFAAKSRVI
jgi:hypothetical protein